MVVRQGVEDVLPLPAEFDQLHLLEYSQLMGDRALGQRDLFRNVCNAQLLHRQQRQNMHPGGIGKALERLSDVLQRFFFRSSLRATPSFTIFLPILP